MSAVNETLIRDVVAEVLGKLGGTATTTTKPSPAPSAPAPKSDSCGCGTKKSSAALEYHKHHNRDGYFQDPLITAASAAKIARDTSWNVGLPDLAWTSPLYVENGPGGKGTFYVATASDNVYAFYEDNGALAWPVKNFGTPATQAYRNSCGNVHPIGVTGTPAIDLATNLIVFDATSPDVNGYVGTHTIYGVSILDGSTSGASTRRRSRRPPD